MNDRELLEYIAAQVGILTTKVGGLTTKVDGIETDMKEGFKKEDTRMTKLEMILENQTNPQIMLLSEGQQGINHKLDSVSEKLIEHDSRFDTLETKIESHDTEITFMKKAR